MGSTLPSGAYSCPGLIGPGGTDPLCRGCLRYLLRAFASRSMAPPARWVGTVLHCHLFLRA